MQSGAVKFGKKRFLPIASQPLLMLRQSDCRRKLLV